MSQSKNRYFEMLYECCVCGDLFSIEDMTEASVPNGHDDFTPELVCKQCSHRITEGYE